MLPTCSVFIADATSCSVNVVQRSVIRIECNTRTQIKKAYRLQETKSEAAVPGNGPGGYHTEVLNHIWYGSIQHNSLAVCQTGSISLNLWRRLWIQRPSSFMINRLLMYYINAALHSQLPSSQSVVTSYLLKMSKHLPQRVATHIYMVSICMLGIWICVIYPCGTVGFFSWIIPLKSLPIVRLQPANSSFYFHCFSKV